MKKRFSEEKVVKILQEVQKADTQREVIRKYNISEQTFYKWKCMYGGMSVSEVKRLKELEKENAKLKKLLSEQLLVNEALKEITEKKW
ncbi:transposase [Nitrosophilus labii]|uniref:transposase n=1 Tax=Nitrosophilus labii TaxID=2706014 RepID=UPI001656A6D5|nr:transposase [Nitrosophilus labii]